MLKFQDRMAIYTDEFQHCQIFFPTQEFGRHIIVTHICQSYIEVEHYGESDCIDLTGLATDLKVGLQVPEVTEREKKLLEMCDFSVDGVYITYVLDSAVPTLKVELLGDETHEAMLILIGEYFEVKTSTLAEVDIYRVKFIVERNSDLLQSGWEEAHARLFEK